MIYPPVFEVCAASPRVLALIGTDPVRLYLFGMANRQGGAAPALPYAVWQLVGGGPENYLGERPDVDAWSVQFDVYAGTAADARAVAAAIRDAIEGVAYVDTWVGDSVDPPTQLKRFTFLTSWWSDRQSGVL